MCGGSQKAQSYVATPKETDSAVQEAIRKERELNQKRKGRQSTILNGGDGLVDNSTKKTMLGE